MNPDHHRQPGIRLSTGRAPNIDEQTIFRRSRKRTGASRCGRTKTPLHTVSAELRSRPGPGPRLNRLGRPPPQLTHRRRRVGDAFKGYDAVLDRSPQKAAVHPHDRIRLLAGAGKYRHQSQQQTCPESGHPNCRLEAIPRFCSHFALPHLLNSPPAAARTAPERTWRRRLATSASFCRSVFHPFQVTPLCWPAALDQSSFFSAKNFDIRSAT